MITKEQQEAWAASGSTEKGVLLYLSEYDHFVSAFFGDGCNLDPDDMENGYNDYINLNTYKYDPVEFIEDDGGMLMFNNEKGAATYQDYYDSLEHFINDSLAFIGFRPGTYESCLILKMYA